VVRARIKARILGLGLDTDDEKTRVTKGPNFHLVGGSQQTHECMQEKCIKFNEHLDAKGKQLEDLDRDEFSDIASECGMNVVRPRNKS